MSPAPMETSGSSGLCRIAPGLDVKQAEVKIRIPNAEARANMAPILRGRGSESSRHEPAARGHCNARSGALEQVVVLLLGGAQSHSVDIPYRTRREAEGGRVP